MRIEGGRAEVRTGGRGTIGLDVRALAQLYTSFESPRTLHARAQIDGPARTLDLVGGAFAGPDPVVPDMC